MPRKHAPVADHCIFIRYHAVERHARTHNGVLKQYGIAHYAAAPDLYTAEYDRIFDLALDYASVGDKSIADR